uniref:Timeless N-terminal domain-containing protein n=1 Tax=Serinus canaria TaxID=9135 RepID=A0A8C9N0E8_SERCA
MFRDQSPEELAALGQGTAVAEHGQDTRELETLRQRELAEKRTRALQRTSRHSRFGGSYVLQGIKSIGDRDVVFHKGLHNVSVGPGHRAGDVAGGTGTGMGVGCGMGTWQGARGQGWVWNVAQGARMWRGAQGWGRGRGRGNVAQGGGTRTWWEVQECGEGHGGGHGAGDRVRGRERGTRGGHEAEDEVEGMGSRMWQVALGCGFVWGVQVWGHSGGHTTGEVAVGTGTRTW